MSQKGGLSILDALDNLNTIVDVDRLDEIEVTEEQRLISHKGEKEGGAREIYWVKAGPDDQTLTTIRSSFETVFDYLKAFYQTINKTGETKKLTEGANTIMLLVGEAAQKMDRMGALFQKKVSECEEYKALQHFYQQKIMPEAFKAFLHKASAKRHPAATEDVLEEELAHPLSEEEAFEIAHVHLLDDLETVRQDAYYELFYLTNEEGHPFYTHQLVNNLKLACDFGVFVDQYFGEDPLLQIKNWEDKELLLRAQHLLKAAAQPLEKFYTEMSSYKDREIVKLLHYSCMALMLAANPRNLIRQFSLKGCHLYFSNFLHFLRELLLHHDFETLEIYGASEGKPFFRHYKELLASFIHTLFIQSVDRKEVAEAMDQLIERAEPHLKDHSLSVWLARAHRALSHTCAHHPDGPIFKALDIVREEEERHAFDPLLLGNLPELSWTFQQGDLSWSLLRLPSPTVQTSINQALISEEFKAFVQGCRGKERLLIFNLQDRTSWREHARTTALEELALRVEYADHLTVVTLAKDTDFYHQRGAYYELNDAREFIEQFLEHLSDENTGYFFPPSLKKALFPHFMDHLLWKIHEICFKHKKTLSCAERLDFIEIAYAFIEWKVIERLKPTYVALSSKDALDSESTASSGLIAWLTIAQHEHVDKKKWNTLLFGPTLMVRERVIQSERFDRLHSLVHRLEKSGDYLTPFTSLFNADAFDWKIS